MEEDNMKHEGWKVVESKEHMLRLEYGRATAFAMAIEVVDPDGNIKNIYRGCIFCNELADIWVVTPSRSWNCNFKSYAELCNRIEKALNVRKEVAPPEPNILELLGV